MQNTIELPKSVLTKKQVKTLGPVEYTEHGQKYRIKAEIRYDDECGNGHNSFAITGDISRATANGRWQEDACGCIHENIAKHFPDYAKYIKWHLTSSNGPMHYVANTVYHASDRDYNGKLKGEPYLFERKLMFNDVPFLYKPTKELLAFIDEVGIDAAWGNFELIELHHKENAKGGYQYKPKVSIALMPVTEWYKAPFDTWDEANNFIHAMTHCRVEIVKRATAYGEGKERDFDAARACAGWPEATDEQLSLPKDELKKLLLDRLPPLLLEFKRDVEELGFTY